jgi:lipopolysaccharide export system protein LptA
MPPLPALALLLAALLCGAPGLRAAPEPEPPAAVVAAPLPACPPDKELCVQADRTGDIDLKTGVAHLDGNVRGLMRSRDLSFRGQSLAAYRDGGQEWVRLVLERDVRVTQGDKVSESDHGVLERDEVRLTGHVRIRDEELRLAGNDAQIRADGSRTVVRGLPHEPMSLLLQRALLAAPPTGQAPAASREQPAGQAPPASREQPAGQEPPAEAATATPVGAEGAATPEAAAAPAEPVTTRLLAQRAVLEQPPRRVTLSGEVRIDQSDQGLHLEAQQVTLFFTPQSTLDSFRAEGNVVITQPERRISADFAQSRNQLRTILLVGHATMRQQGKFDLKSDRMEVYSDASKGLMESHDHQKPITLSLELGGGTSYGLTQAGMLRLSQQNVAPAVLDKLAPLIGKTYPSRTAFREAVTGRLTNRESEKYLDAILATAH